MGRPRPHPPGARAAPPARRRAKHRARRRDRQRRPRRAARWRRSRTPRARVRSPEQGAVRVAQRQLAQAIEVGAGGGAPQRLVLRFPGPRVRARHTGRPWRAPPRTRRSQGRRAGVLNLDLIEGKAGGRRRGARAMVPSVVVASAVAAPAVRSGRCPRCRSAVRAAHLRQSHAPERSAHAPLAAPAESRMPRESLHSKVPRTGVEALWTRAHSPSNRAVER